MGRHFSGTQMCQCVEFVVRVIYSLVFFVLILSQFWLQERRQNSPTQTLLRATYEADGFTLQQKLINPVNIVSVQL